MKYGIKIYAGNSQNIFPKLAKDIPFDFVEAMIEPTADFSYLKEYNFEFVIHTAHSLFGINLANPKKKEKNTQAIQKAIEASDELNADTIITHPGYVENEECNLENVFKFLEQTNCEKIILENLCPSSIHKSPHLGYTLEDMRNIDSHRIRICLDIGHASMQAHNENKDYLDFIKELVALNPKHYHFTDCILEKYTDHIHFGDGDLDLKAIKSLVPKDARISLETKLDDKLKQDFEYIRSI